ncbi:hypothetical protein AAC387_Pa03g3265 [Persea americana]
MTGRAKWIYSFAAVSFHGIHKGRREICNGSGSGSGDPQILPHNKTASLVAWDGLLLLFPKENKWKSSASRVLGDWNEMVRADSLTTDFDDFENSEIALYNGEILFMCSVLKQGIGREPLKDFGGNGRNPDQFNIQGEKPMKDFGRF